VLQPSGRCCPQGDNLADGVGTSTAQSSLSHKTTKTQRLAMPQVQATPALQTMPMHGLQMFRRPGGLPGPCNHQGAWLAQDALVAPISVAIARLAMVAMSNHRSRFPHRSLVPGLQVSLHRPSALDSTAAGAIAACKTQSPRWRQCPQNLQPLRIAHLLLLLTPHRLWHRAACRALPLQRHRFFHWQQDQPQKIHVQPRVWEFPVAL